MSSESFASKCSMHMQLLKELDVLTVISLLQVRLGEGHNSALQRPGPVEEFGKDVSISQSPQANLSDLLAPSTNSSNRKHAAGSS